MFKPSRLFLKAYFHVQFYPFSARFTNHIFLPKDLKNSIASGFRVKTLLAGLKVNKDMGSSMYSNAAGILRRESGLSVLEDIGSSSRLWNDESFFIF